jgi:hypothetical protein
VDRDRVKRLTRPAVIAGTLSGVLTILAGVWYQVKGLQPPLTGVMTISHGVFVLGLAYGVRRHRLGAAVLLLMQLFIRRAMVLGHADPRAVLYGIILYGVPYGLGIYGLLLWNKDSQSA